MNKIEQGREKLLELLGEAGSRPAAEVIDALTCRKYGVSPALELATVMARPAEFADRLLAEVSLTPADVLARAEALPDEHHAYCLHTFALYLLGLWEDTRAFAPIVAYLSADPAEAELQLDESLFEDMPAILARTYGGAGVGPLKALIETATEAPYLQATCLNALHAMARLGKLDRDEMLAVFERQVAAAEAGDNPEYLGLMAVGLLDLQEQRFREPIERWLREGRIDEALLGLEDLDEAYATPYEDINERLLRTETFDRLIDYFDEWAWFSAGDWPTWVPSALWARTAGTPTLSGTSKPDLTTRLAAWYVCR